MLRAKNKIFKKIFIPVLINIHTSILQVLINYLCVPPPLRREGSRGEGVEGEDERGGAGGGSLNTRI